MSVESVSIGQIAVWRHQAKSQPRARLLLTHGICEHSGRHLPTINALIQAGIEVVRFDLRGMGHSGGTRQWVNSFSDYVEDLQKVHHWTLAQLPPMPLFLMGHSLGGAIALTFASKYHSTLEGLILSAPAFIVGESVSPLKIKIGKILVKFLPKLRLPANSLGDGLSRNPEVGKAYISDPLCFLFNTLQQGDEVLEALKKLPELVGEIRCPTIFFHGSADSVILSQGSFQLFQAIGAKQRELYFLPGGYHEPHNDIDSENYFRLLKIWLDRQLLPTRRPTNVLNSLETIS